MWVRLLQRIRSSYIAGPSSLPPLPQRTYHGFAHRRIRGVPAAMAFRVSPLHFHREQSCVPAGRTEGSREDLFPQNTSRTSPPTYTEEGGSLPSFGIHVLVSLLREENARDVCVIKIPPEMKYVDYFVVVSGMSTRHIQAMAQYSLRVFKSLKKSKASHVVIEGKETDDWMCIDFGNIVVHFMLPETRELYELEKLWTLRSYDDQLSQMAPEILPLDFTFGLQSPKE